jgi:hypothetical protein
MKQLGLPSSLINGMIEGWHPSCYRAIAQASIGHLNAVDTYASIPAIKVPRGSLPVFGNPGIVFDDPGSVFDGPDTSPTLLGPEVFPVLALNPEVPPLLRADSVPILFTPYMLLIVTEVIATADAVFAAELADACVLFAALVDAGVLFAAFVVEVFSGDKFLLLPLFFSPL